MDWKRRSLWNYWLSFRNLRQGNLDRLLELWITSSYYVSRSDLNIEIRRHTYILYAPTRPARIVGRTIWQLYAPTVDQAGGEVVRSNASTGGSLTDDWTNLRELEHEGTSFSG